jgi:cytochrome c-type biogenesis protein CcmH/NrfF
MEETVVVFDVNILWAIPLGIVIGAGIMWFWLKKKNKPDILANGILTKVHKAPKQGKKHPWVDNPWVWVIFFKRV